MIKKIIITCLLLLSSFILIEQSFAAEGQKRIIKTVVTEPVPGTECKKLEPQNKVTQNGNPVAPLWECSFESGTKQAVSILGSMIRFFTVLVSLLGVLFLVYNGILYSMGGLDQSLKEESKKRIIATLVGLLLLFTSGYVLQMIAPWIYKS